MDTHPILSPHSGNGMNPADAALTPRHADHPAVDAIPAPVFVLTASHDGRQTGLAVNLVQLASLEPPTVFVSMPKGHPISPMIRDSRVFGLCQLAADDRLLLKRFKDADDNTDANPFDGLNTETLATGVPLLADAMTALDCEVAMHLDIEADYEVYMARVLKSRSTKNPDPMISLRATR